MPPVKEAKTLQKSVETYFTLPHKPCAGDIAAVSAAAENHLDLQARGRVPIGQLDARADTLGH